MRFLKAALIVLAVLAVIVAGAAAFLLSRIDEKLLVREAQAAVKSATGRTLGISGKVGLRIVSLRPAVVAENVRLSNAPWGSRPDMVRARRVEAEFDLLPLFRGTVRIGRLVFLSPDILLESDAKGRANWNFDAEPATGKAAETPAAVSLVGIETGALQIRDGVLVYRNKGRGTQTRLEIGALNVRDAREQGLDSIAMSGSVNGRAFDVKGTTGDLALLLAPRGTFPLDLALTGEMARVSAKGRVIDPLGRADLHVQVEVESVEVAELAAILNRRVAPLGPLKARAVIERDKGRLSLRDLDLALGRPGSLEVSARGSITDLLKPAGAALEFNAAIPETAQAPAFNASGRLEDYKGGIRVSGLKISSGTNQLTGTFEYHPGTERPQVITSLEGVALDLGSLAPPANGSGGEPKSGGPLFPREPLPLARLRALDVDARVTLGALVLPNRVTLRDVKATLALHGGRLQVDPVTFLAGGGQTSATMILDAARDEADLSLRLEGRGIVLGDLLAGTVLTDKVKGGPMNMNLEFTTQGSSPHEWAASLNGNLRMEAGKASSRAREIKYGSDVVTQMLDAVNPFRETDPEVQVQCAALKLAFSKGVAQSDRSVGVETNKISVLSSGTLDLGKEMMDINIRPRLKEGIGLGGANMANWVRVTGPITDPKLGVDFGGVAGTTASIAAGIATGGLSLLGEKLLETATAENACKVALGPRNPGSIERAPAGDPAEQPVTREPTPVQPPPQSEGGGFFNKLFGK